MLPALENLVVGQPQLRVSSLLIADDVPPSMEPLLAFPPRPRLPPELLLRIVECVVPANPRALMPASHIVTKTLLSLTRVSRATHGHASNLLRQRCLFVDSGSRLACVLACMARLVPTLPPVVSLRHVTSLYLAPFGPSLVDIQTAERTRQLLCEVSDTLRRLVVHMPFSSLDPIVDDHLAVRRTLRQGFEQLLWLEEFVCLGEYPALTVPEAHTDVWRLWPNLRRLALFGVPVDSHWLWWDIATLPELAHVVLARPQNVTSTNIKDEYFHKLPRQDSRLSRAIRIVLVEAAQEMAVLDTARWREIDPADLMTVELYKVPVVFYRQETAQELVTDLVKRGALQGVLWSWTGDKAGES
ncbi:F-box-like domain-containing protein [Ophiocordyceps camponoti-floridani]|uniref:F-box-like domain-containing protein n=1 Tax=Ophiocordyceps camponoti-floridani TaxID=2030778 RepID=A0A8H4VG13_9HYPO|nr:F-box-like domain-containing protein [Ophiocordyceps camponoti-floridani]